MANLSEPDSPISGPMRIGPSESKDRTTRPNRGPSRASVVLVAISVSLLALLAWSLNPRRPNFKPAPLYPPSSICVNPSRAFVPSNATDISAPILNTLPAEVRSRVIHRLNFEECTCGCKMSIASCLLTNPDCETARRLFKEVIDDEKKKASNAQGKK